MLDVLAPVLARAKAQSAEAVRLVRGTAANAKEETVRNSRNDLGRMVREVWIEWAREQPSPKPSWILSWDELSEPDREVDRRIDERLAEHGWKDADRRIAELEQANRDLERLRVEASRECDEAQEHRRILREWIEKDKTGLYAALTKIVKAIEARGWITDGRGPYEWDDDRYREEAGWAFDEVRKIVVDAQKESDKRMRSALTETPES